MKIFAFVFIGFWVIGILFIFISKWFEFLLSKKDFYPKKGSNILLYRPYGLKVKEIRNFLHLTTDLKTIQCIKKTIFFRKSGFRLLLYSIIVIILQIIYGVFCTP